MDNHALYNLACQVVSNCEDRIQWANEFLNSDNPSNQYTIMMPSEYTISLLKYDGDGVYKFSGGCTDCQWFSLRDASEHTLAINAKKLYDKKCRVVSKIELAKMVLEHENNILPAHLAFRDELKKQIDETITM